MERQRNPGVGYWSSRPDISSISETRSSTSSSSGSRGGSPTPIEPRAVNKEEDINLEYLRNVILQFLEHEEMRVRILFFPDICVLFADSAYLSRIWFGFYQSFCASPPKKHDDCCRRCDVPRRDASLPTKCCIPGLSGLNLNQRSYLDYHYVYVVQAFCCTRPCSVLTMLRDRPSRNFPERSIHCEALVSWIRPLMPKE